MAIGLSRRHADALCACKQVREEKKKREKLLRNAAGRAEMHFLISAQ